MLPMLPLPSLLLPLPPSSWVLVHHVATRLHAKLQVVERPDKGRNRDLALIAWSTCKSSYIRNQGTALIRMVPVWAGGPSRITSYTTSPIYHPLQDAFGQECYILWEHECMWAVSRVHINCGTTTDKKSPKTHSRKI